MFPHAETCVPRAETFFCMRRNDAEIRVPRAEDLFPPPDPPLTWHKQAPKAISRIGHAMGLVYYILENFDKSILKSDTQGWHKVLRLDKDI